jgi:hypothetical protein
MVAWPGADPLRKSGKAIVTRLAQAPTHQRGAAAGPVIRRETSMNLAQKASMSGF